MEKVSFDSENFNEDAKHSFQSRLEYLKNQVYPVCLNRLL